MSEQKRLIAYARKRRAAMQKLRAQRWTFREIAEKYGVSWQRVQQVVSKEPA